MGSSSSRGCSKHTDAAAPHCLSHSRQHQPLTHPHNTPKGARAALTPPSEPWRKPLTHFGSFRAGRLLRPLMGALRPAQPQRVAPLTYWPLPAMEAGGWYGPCCSILQSKAIHATIDPPTPSWVETCGSGWRPATSRRRLGRKKSDDGKKERSLMSTDGAIDTRILRRLDAGRIYKKQRGK